MSAGYADRLKKGVWKGKCGLPEQIEPEAELDKKVRVKSELSSL